MEGESPLHTHLLKRSRRPRICSSDEEDQYLRPVKAPESSICSDCSGSVTYPSSSGKTPQVDEELGTLITLMHPDPTPWDSEVKDRNREQSMDSATMQDFVSWESEMELGEAELDKEEAVDGDASHTSTPDCKRGKHQGNPDRAPQS